MGQAPIPIREQFTPEEQQQVIELFNQGKTQEEIGVVLGRPRRTIMKLCKILKLKRTVSEAAKLKISSPLDKPEIIQQIQQLRHTHTLQQIATKFSSSISAVYRICQAHNISLDKEAFTALQSKKMKQAWTPEKKQAISGSTKYPRLNDKEWLADNYRIKSAGEIARDVGCPVGVIIHHLKRHGIILKSRKECLSQLRRKASYRKHIVTRWGTFLIQSKNEAKFLASLPDSTVSVEVEPEVFEAHGSTYAPDFKVDGEYTEVKPPEYAMLPGIDRQRFIKQLLVAEHNGIELKAWYKGKYFDYEPIADIDRYFALNWKLLFQNYEECYDFLVKFGFHPLQWHRDILLLGLKSLFAVSDPWNANCRKENVLFLIKHFNPHYWYSTHNGYNTIASVFQHGNLTVLRSALQILWAQPNNCNIYGLTKVIARQFKDFATVSIFKPWVAREVYKQLLPNGGRIVDPCMGWGGRFLATLDSQYEYIGYDLNPNAIEAHNNMRKLIGSRVNIEPTFTLADSSKITFPECDMIFTSPPYDSCELYHGIDSTTTVTSTILENIFMQEPSPIISLNLPKRQVKMCLGIAEKYDYELAEKFEMKTSSFQGREKTYEPILVFKK